MYLNRYGDQILLKNTKKSIINKNIFQNTLKILFFLLISHFIIHSESCSNFKKDSKIRLRRNGYSNIIIGIEDDVEENVQLIEQIKETFTEASEFLFKITKKRAFFSNITIVLPSTWKLENYFDDYDLVSSNGKLQNTTWESYDKADICIENRDPSTIDIPFVVNHATSCGETASHINFSPDFFLNKNRATRMFGSYEKVLIHYWTQFRYGVFPEYPHKSVENNQEFYFNQNGEIEATRCNFNITGRLLNPFSLNKQCNNFLHNGLPSTDCIFEEDKLDVNVTKKMGSLMYKPFLDQITEFCDNDTENSETYHNRFAPTLQNMECNGKSIWEVLNAHEDFIDYRNMPNNLITNTRPKFKILKNRVKKIVLLIDKSIEIQLTKKYENIEKALRDYVKFMLSENNLIGIIHFENFAKIALPMTLVSDNLIREKILDSIIPTQPNGKKSNIWNGISLALSLLKSTVNSNDKLAPTGGNIILITNTHLDSNYPNKNLIIDQIKKNEIVFDYVRLSENSDPSLESIAHLTDGLNFLIRENHHYLDLDNSLAYLSNRETKNSKNIVQLVDTFYESDSVPLINTIHIDKSISSRSDSILKIIFSMKNIKNYVDINVYEPSHKKHQSKYNLKCKDSAIFSDDKSILEYTQEIACEFKKPKHGTWLYKIKNSYDQPFDLHLKAFVFFHNYEDTGSYYSNYYDRDDDYDKKKLKRQIFYYAENSIRVKANWAKSFVIYPMHQAIYVTVSKGLKPILNAVVTATIYRPSGDYITLNLFDNGLYADRYKDDGIYSRYFTSFSLNGSYYGKIDISVDNDTKINMQKIVGTPFYEHYPSIGIVNKIDENSFHLPFEKLQRTVNLGPFMLKNFSTEFDLIRPSKIRDLQMIEFDHHLKMIKFEFTAPGDDYDLGSCSGYEIKSSYDPLYLLKNDDEMNNYENEKDLEIQIISSSFSFNRTNQGGSRENFIVDSSSLTGDTFSIKIRAIDFYNNTSEWSNILTIKLNKQIKFSAQLKIDFNQTDSDLHFALDRLKSIKEKERIHDIYFMGFTIFLSIVIAVQITMIILLGIRKCNEKPSNIARV